MPPAPCAQQRPAARGPRRARRLHWRTQRWRGVKKCVCNSYPPLKDYGVEGLRTVDHVSQQSVYFNDQDGNVLEIYYELPNAPELFRQGREDRDEPLVMTR
jgi:hypothetical protein